MSISLKSFILIIFSLLFFIKENTLALNIDVTHLQLQHKSPEIRLSAIEELGKIKSEETVKILMAVVEDRYEDWKLRGRAIRLLGEAKNPIAIDLLIKFLNDIFLNDDCPAMKLDAVIALGNFKDQRVINTLTDMLNDDLLTIREAAIFSLGEIGDNKTLPYLISLLNDKSFTIRKSAIYSLGKIGDPEAIPFLRQLLDREHDPLIKNKASIIIQLLSKD